MKERKSYAVFWQHAFYPGEWLRSCEWSDTMNQAYRELGRIKKNERCAGAKVVERTETFKELEVWKNDRY